MLAWGCLALSTALLAQNQSWPNEMPDTAPEALALLQNMPGDPDYFTSNECLGQSELYSFTPTCAESLIQSQRPDGLGISADRAWLFTTGHPEVRIAVFGEGVDWNDVELVSAWALNPNELPMPVTATTGTNGEYDRNQDGVFNVLDYTSATGTTAPRLERIIDLALLDRPDQGDANGNGILDPGDLILIFTNGIDEDQNGVIDDICGWDFIDGDANAQTSTLSLPINSSDNFRMRAIAGEANNGVGGLGVCPRCSIIPIRISHEKRIRASHLVNALRYVGEQNMRLVSISQLPSRPFDVQRDELKQVMMALNAKNILTVIDAPKQSRAETELPWPKEYSLVIGEITADHSVLSQAQTVFHPSRCANAGPSISLVAPGNCNELSGALVTGAAGLVLSAAKGISRLGIDELEKELNTAELKQILQSSGDQATPHDPQNNQANPSFQTQSGYGRINARSAIESVIQRKIPPLVRIVQPQAYDQIDPTAGQPFVITARVENKRHELAEWTLEYALGTQAEDDDFIPVSRGTIRKGEEIDVVGEIPSNGLISDPTAPPFTQYSASMTLRVSVAAETDGGLTQSEVRQIVFLHRDLYLLPGFPKALELDAALPAVFIDVNADDQDEMVLVSRDRKIHAINYGGEPVNGWPIDLTFTGHPAALSHGTLGLDSTPSLVIVTEDGAVDVIGLDRVRRTGYPIVFPITNNVHVRFPTILYDLDGDQNKELIVASENGQIMAWHSDAKPVAGFPIELDQIIGPLAVGHFGDSEKTGIVAASRKQLFLIDADDDDQFHIGQIWTLPEQKAPFALPTGPVIANVDQDDEDEILLAQVNGAVVRFDPPVADHTVLTSHARTNFGMGSQIRLDGPPVFCAQGQSSLGDLDRDGLIEIVHPSAATAFEDSDYLGPFGLAESLISAWDAQTGTMPRGFPLDRNSKSRAPALIIDLDRDRRPEVIFADGHYRIQALSVAGVSPKGWPKAIDGSLIGPIAIGDFNGDKELELLATTSKGSVFVWRTRLPKDTPMAWPFPRHDHQATANYSTKIQSTKTGEEMSSCHCRNIDSTGTKTVNSAWLATFFLVMALFGRRFALGRLRK